MIIIDDIDRLPTDEIRQIFRMVKSVADLPYVTYLLVFDRKIVERALEKDTDPEGPQWIEKIVQGSFDLPHIIPFKLRQFFWKKLKNDIPDLYKELENNCASVFREFLYPQLKSLRQVNRLINALIVGWLSVKNIVSPTSFTIIESWRLFNHDLYEFIRDNKDYFSDKTSFDNGQKKLPENIKEKIDCYNKVGINLYNFFSINGNLITYNLKHPIFISSNFYNYFIYDNNSTLLSPSELSEVESSLNDFEQAQIIIKKLSNNTLDPSLSKIRALINDWMTCISSYPDDKITRIIYWITFVYKDLISTEKKSKEYNIQDEIDGLITQSFKYIRCEESRTIFILKLYEDFPFNPLLINFFIDKNWSSTKNTPINYLENLGLNTEKIQEIYQQKIEASVSIEEDISLYNLIKLFLLSLKKEWTENFLNKHLDLTIKIINYLNNDFRNRYHKELLSYLFKIAKETIKSDRDENDKKIAQKLLKDYNVPNN